MIEIRDGRIYFHHAYKTEVQARDYQCLSAYVCPACKNVLLAYYVGYLADLREYIENDTMKHAYDTGSCHGGQWLKLQEYNHDQACKWRVTSARGITGGVKAFLKRYDAVMTNQEALCDVIEKGSMAGFKLVPDEIGADGPLLMYNEFEIIEGAGLTFDERWKRIGKIGEYLDSKL